ncbi:MAG: chorismate synthase [Deltaproteobacteria bacterium]|nr:chorismate synthase [Deltaproteobacteria bacterium]
MLTYITAGESHGKGLISVIEGMPSNLTVKSSYVNSQLKRRQKGYGRGGRMKIESDTVEFLSGIRHEVTTGAPVSLFIENKDWKNWTDVMSPQLVESLDSDKAKYNPVTKPRPGHADLSGAIKYNQRDIRNILERSSARETAARVAAGSVARQLLEQFGIITYSWVTGIGGVEDDNSPVKGSIYYGNPKGDKKILHEIYEDAEKSEVSHPDEQISEKMKRRIDEAKENGDSLGGIFEVVISGLPVGLGSHVHSHRKLDSLLAGAMMGIQAIKGVEIGLGFEEGRRPGSAVHDEIKYDGKEFRRQSNYAGGIEGGMSNGEDIVIRAAMKPIPTLYKPLRSVDINSKQPFEASIERSDTCAVPAAAVIGEAVAAFEIARVFLEKFGGDSIEEIKKNHENYMNYVSNF